jgi:hypothetical protein
MPVPILKQGDVLIASIQSDLSDHDLVQLRDDVAEKVGRFKSLGVVIDVSMLDVMIRSRRGRFAPSGIPLDCAVPRRLSSASSRTLRSPWCSSV